MNDTLPIANPLPRTQAAAPNSSKAGLEQANMDLRSSAIADGLTGLMNHRGFQEELARLCRCNNVISLLMLDVDYFKPFNAQFGHPAGDEVLQTLAAVLSDCVGNGDLIARYGGEEFTIVLPGYDQDRALSLAERIRRAVQVLPTNHRAITVSIGISTAQGRPPEAQLILEEAEVALYAAKASGRNRARHHRHLKKQPTAITPCKQACAPSANGCLKCEAVPATPAQSEGAALLLGPHDADAEAALRRVLESTGFATTRIGPVLVAKEIQGRLEEVATLLKDGLSPYSRSCIQAAYMPTGVTTPDQAMAALMFARPLNEMIETIEHEWVRDALSQGRLFSVFHPIIDAQTGMTFAHEALLRARSADNAKIIGAGQIIDACAKLNLQHQLDQRARQAAIRGAAEHLPALGHVFINFLPNTIYDPEICLRTTMEAAAANNLETSRLVFEVVETEKIPDMAHLLHILDYYRSRGMGTAIDDMGAGHTDFDYITALRPDFVKLDRDLVLDAERCVEGRVKMDSIIKSCKDYGAKVIAEGIETPVQMALCVDAGVDYLQGFLFAKPACPPQAVTCRRQCRVATPPDR